MPFSMSQRSLGDVSQHGIGAALRGLVEARGRREGQHQMLRSALEGPIDVGPVAPGTRIARRDAGAAEMAQEIEDVRNDPNLTLQNKMNVAWNLPYGRQRMEMGGWGDFFDVLQDKHVNWGGFGRTKDLDVPTGRYYDRESGEVAPGRRGSVNQAMDPNAAYATTVQQQLNPTRGGWYAQDEWQGMGPWAKARVGFDAAQRVGGQTYGGY